MPLWTAPRHTALSQKPSLLILIPSLDAMDEENDTQPLFINVKDYQWN